MWIQACGLTHSTLVIALQQDRRLGSNSAERVMRRREGRRQNQAERMGVFRAHHLTSASRGFGFQEPRPSGCHRKSSSLVARILIERSSVATQGTLRPGFVHTWILDSELVEDRVRSDAVKRSTTEFSEAE
jgi:hypothetical protein